MAVRSQSCLQTWDILLFVAQYLKDVYEDDKIIVTVPVLPKENEDNFDESERLEMLADPGAMIISYCKDGIEKLLTDNIFAPLQKDKVCNNIGVIHQDKNDVEIDTIIAEVGKPLNISEGWGGKCTLIAVSGMSFPVDHIQRLGKLAVDGQKERQHNIKMAKEQSLPTLDFNNIEKPKIKNNIDKPKLTGRDALLAMRKKARA